MIPLYQLYNVVDYKTDIKGYWKDKDKVYIDNIDIQNYTIINSNIMYLVINRLFCDGELSVFYTFNDKAYIIDNDYNKTVLDKCIRYNKKHITKDYINSILDVYNGCTIFKNKNDYTIEIWQ